MLLTALRGYNQLPKAIPGILSLKGWLRLRCNTGHVGEDRLGSGTVFQQRSLEGPLYHQIAVVAAAAPKMPRVHTGLARSPDEFEVILSTFKQAGMMAMRMGADYSIQQRTAHHAWRAIKVSDTRVTLRRSLPGALRSHGTGAIA
jgi:hypothetical protein